ncbi:MAG: riboflavin synthase [Verrucomicrobia bacterium]|nr:riboflavin synthase [Verrucomicrobiota bacterium]
MFTGIVESCGEVRAMESVEAGFRLSLGIPFAEDLRQGESVAVNGCCLTVTMIKNDVVTFDLLAETCRVTNLGDLKAGGVVNLERALKATDRMSGHFVQGHVDCTSEILELEAVGQDYRLKVSLPENFARYLINKGSICVDGMSLTAAEVGEDSFTIWLIPHTMEITNLKERQVGQRVNLEFDMLAKYVEKLVGTGPAI